MERVIRFFDSLVREVREGAWTWLTAESPGWHDSGLWSRLVETPYDDVRLHFVADRHFQSLRSYRQTRFSVDPAGFSVATSEAADMREEKIDLPTSWLRGLMTLQLAMTMPGQIVSLPRGTVYSVLAFFKRHKPSRSPRAIRFELIPGQPPQIVLEPWEQRIVSRGAAYEGPPIEPVRVWGGRRLLVLGRTLPLAERVDVHLLGTGLPHFWVVRIGEMSLTLGLSGWTTNDWTRGSALDLLAPPAAPSPDLISNVAAVLRERHAANESQIAQAIASDENTVASALRHLAKSGQVIHDLPSLPLPPGEGRGEGETAEGPWAHCGSRLRLALAPALSRRERGKEGVVADVMTDNR
ncbi:MAG TPA: hypothetical protein VN541_13310 [Tepidisphaeraceae bacterium]|nr:hypothetical protein [Tepidisphaeraceae bacterium]